MSSRVEPGARFHIKEEVIAKRFVAGEAARGDSPRVKEWQARFPDRDPKFVAWVATDLFPATSAETFGRWTEIRSAITPDQEAAEPILQEEPDRATIFPVRDEDMWKFRKQLEKLHWVAQEPDLSHDAGDREYVSDDEFALLKKVLGWFGPADEAIMEGLDEVAAGHLKTKEAQFYLRAQGDQECVHSEAYSLQIQEVISDDDERGEVLAAVKRDPLVARVADWIRWWVVADHPAADFFAAMAFTEGVLFSGFFAALQFFKARPARAVFDGVTTLNEWIARDEGIHASFWCFILARRLRKRPDTATVAAISRETLHLSDDFFTSTLPRPIPGLTADLLKQYVRCVADDTLRLADFEKIYDVKNPFSFMDRLALNSVGKTNFFESRVSQYQSLGEDALKLGTSSAPILLPED